MPDDGEHSHPEPDVPAIPVVTPIVNAGAELVQPVIDQASKLSSLEERLVSEISRVRDELSQSIDHATSGPNARVDALESKLAELIAKVEAIPAQAVEEAPAAAEAAEVAVETPAKVVRYVRRNGKKVKREG